MNRTYDRGVSGYTRKVSDQRGDIESEQEEEKVLDLWTSLFSCNCGMEYNHIESYFFDEWSSSFLWLLGSSFPRA